MFSKKNVMWWFAVLLWFSIFSCFAYEMTEQERLWAWINCWESTDSWCSQTKRRYEEQVKGKTEIEMLKLENKVKEKNKELEAQKNELEKKQAGLEPKPKESKESKEIQESKMVKKVETKNYQLPSEIELVKTTLGSKASVIESLVPIIKSKDSETQQKVNLILETFKASKDDYTRSVWIYLSYLLK